MPKVSLYNQKGERTGEASLSDRIFGVQVRPSLVHEVAVARRANARKAVASTKTRGEVRGGGKKPWKQKGTGRARQGSTRAPQWVGGGITFGPTSERNFHVKINKKTQRQALFMILSDRVADNKLIVLEGIATEPAKTQVMAKMLNVLPVGKKTLIVAPNSSPMLIRMVRNLPRTKLVTVGSVSLLDVLAFPSLIFLKDAVPVFEKIYHA